MNTQTPINQIRGRYLHLLIEECKEIIKKAPTTPQKYFIEKEEEKEPFFNLGLALKMFLSKFENIITIEEIAEKMNVRPTTLKRILFNYEQRRSFKKVTIDDFMDKVEKLVNKEFGTEEDFFNNELEVAHV